MTSPKNHFPIPNLVPSFFHSGFAFPSLGFGYAFSVTKWTYQTSKQRATMLIRTRMSVMRSSGEAETTAKAWGVRIPERKSTLPIFFARAFKSGVERLCKVSSCDLEIS